MDAQNTSPESANDLSALAWVNEELRRSLEAAHKALRRYLKETEAHQQSDIDAIDPTVLRGARTQFHQGAGALELVGLPAAAAIVRASEAAVQRLVSKPQKLTLPMVETIERASFALLEYLSRLLAGKPVSPIAMFPQYRAVQEMAGAERIHPADLWQEDWHWRDLPLDYAVVPRVPDAHTRAEVESGVLGLMRTGSTEIASRLSDLFAALAAGAEEQHNATTWRLAAGFFESQAQGLLHVDNYSKRIASRLLSQLRMIERGEYAATERLAQDLLFFCAQSESPGDGRSAPRLAAVRQAFGLSHHTPVSYETSSLGRFDPAWIVQARKRVAAAKDAWSSVAGGESHRLAGLNEQFALMADSVRRLYPSGDALADELGGASAQTVQSDQTPEPALAMEVATSVLYIEASLEDGEFDHPMLGARVRRLAERIAAVRRGLPAEPLEDWMEELYRRVSDRQTMGSVVQELRASLADAEKHIDQYFRDPSDRSALIPAPPQLAAMRGVLSVLGMDQASVAVLRMHDEVDSLLTTEVDQERSAYNAVFERLAGNLGALGFLIDMLSVQPQLAKSLFVFDAQAGTLNPVMGRHKGPSWTGNPLPGVVMPVEPRLIEQAQSLAFAAIREDVPVADVSRDLELLSQEATAAELPDLAATVAAAQSALDHAADAVDESAAREQLALAMNDFVVSSSEPMGLDALTPAMPALFASAPPATSSGLEDDDEMREVFLEEAREVLVTANEALDGLANDSQDVTLLTTVRRAFHTLKGSGRMVGLNEFGEAAWACEQLYNARLAERAVAEEPLLGFSHEVLGYLSEWVEAIAAGGAVHQQSAPVRAAADALRLHGERRSLLAEPAPLALPETLDGAVAFAPIGFPADLPSAADLDLAAPPAQEPEPTAAEVPAVPDGLDFELDLGAFEPTATVPLLPPAPEPAAEPMMFDLGFDEPGEAGEPDDMLATIPMPLREVSEQPLPVPEQSFELIDLDLDLDFAMGEAPRVEAAPEGQLPSIESPTAEFAPVDIDELPLEAPLVIDFGELAMPQAIEPELLPEPVAEPEAMAEPLPEPVVSLPPEAEVRPEAEALAEPEAEAAPPAVAVEMAEVIEVAEVAEVAEVDLPTDHEAEPIVETAHEPEAEIEPDEVEQVKVIGPLRIGIPLFNIFLNEADELSRRLGTELAEWSMELHRPVGESAVALAHSLAGSSATVGFAELSQLARGLEHALARAQAIGHGTEDEGRLFVAASEEIRRLLHQFAAGFLKSPSPELLQRLADHEVSSALRMEAMSAAAEADEAEAPGVDAWVEPKAELQAETEPELEPQQEPEPVPVPVPALHPEPVVEPEPSPELEPVHEALAAVEPMPEPAMPEPVFAGLAQPELKSLSALPDDIALHAAQARPDALDADDDIDAVDAVDAELFPIFEEEGEELLAQLASRLRDWARKPGDPGLAAACMRTLHTLKGGARLAGAMRLGEMAHRLETAIDHLLSRGAVQAADVEPLQGRADGLVANFEALRQRDAETYEAAQAAVADAQESAPAALSLLKPVPVPERVLPEVDLDLDLTDEPAPAEASVDGLLPDRVAPAAPPAALPITPPAPRTPIDWSRFVQDPSHATAVADRPVAPINQSAVRVRAPLLERLVNQAGEVSITRARIESELGTLKGALGDLTDNLQRLRDQLRDIELQAETQLASRMEAAKAASEAFDPLESDRFTRFQELTRMMAESVNDVATVQRTLQRTLEATEDELAAQARLTRDLQDDLLRTRMVEFEGLSDRLYRVVRLAAKETGKQVRLDIVGGSIEVDRGVLDRMTAAFEHLLRNCVSHGIEMPEKRIAAGKDPIGTIMVVLSQEGNEVGVEFRDDGQGLDLLRIRAKGVKMGWLDDHVTYNDAELANLIFTAGFTTAETITELAGRGIGMDVVRSDVNAMGGRIETATDWGKGTSFKLVLPLTTAVTQVVMLRCGETTVAVPSTLVEIVRRATPGEVDSAYASGSFMLGEHSLPFFWLGSLLQLPGKPQPAVRMLPVVVIRSAKQRIVVHVDEVLGNQEVVVKNLGPQLSRMPGLAGMTLLASGLPALIYNPVALATLYGAAARAATLAELEPPADAPPTAVDAPQGAPLVLVVDDSLTVRRVTQRLLVREGYRVTLAKDGLDALEKLALEQPDVVLSDIEMPRMDGFDLVRNLRGDSRWKALPVIMITSRIAQKHRDLAGELGVDHYLGKPYAEEDLLALIQRYVAAAEAG